MWISKRKWNALVKRMADLENKIQGQQIILFSFPDSDTSNLIIEQNNKRHADNFSVCI